MSVHEDMIKFLFQNYKRRPPSSNLPKSSANSFVVSFVCLTLLLIYCVVSGMLVMSFFFRQILVTVPQCLEILFLSPHKQDWTKNVKYVIFDEVNKTN